jgi:hypothetical protein
MTIHRMQTCKSVYCPASASEIQCHCFFGIAAGLVGCEKKNDYLLQELNTASSACKLELSQTTQAAHSLAPCSNHCGSGEQEAAAAEHGRVPY